jgi:hypothetical protein
MSGPNELASWLKMYDEQMGPTPTYQRSPSPWVSQEATSQWNNADAYNARGARLNGAMELMNQLRGRGQASPDFFGGGQRPQYREPQQFQPSAPQAYEAPQRNPQIQNFLSQFMGRR